MNKIQIAALLTVFGGALALYALADEPSHQGRKGGKHGMMPPIEQVDTNGDGNITLDEIKTHKAERFSLADTNGDGAVTAEEFAAHHEAKKAERQAKRQERAFSAMDADENGVISAEEHAAFRAERMEAHFARVDTDGDGMISEAEREAAKGKRKGKRGQHGKRQAPEAE